MRSLVGAALALLVVLCAGCGGSRKLAASDLHAVVLQRSDLPAWTRFQNDPGTHADAGALGSPDRIGDWIARYRKGAAIIVSRVDLYRSAGAAHTVYGRLTAQSGTPGAEPAALSTLGNERAAFSSGTYRSVIWRRGNAISSLVVQGGGADATKLAREQDTRLTDALS